VASHGRDEEKMILAAQQAAVAYIGLVASRKRGAAVLADLDLPPERVHTPAGLDIGAHTPLEIAVSIVAELISVGSRTRPPARPTVELPLLAAAAPAVDPVCGMSVAAVAASLHVDLDGRTWYFCGPGCKSAFTDDPAQYGA
jgi:xanthine dehydrogenase accessory factor